MQPFTNVVFWDVFHINGLACEQLMAPDSDQSCLVAVRENYLPVIIEHMPWAAVHETTEVKGGGIGCNFIGF